MSFFNKKDKDKKTSPIFSKSLNFKKTSSLGKTSGFSKPTGNFFSRLKKLSKKDIALVAAGVGTLALAPVAEYYLSKPAGENPLTSRFGNRGTIGDSSIYEPGINSLSVGSPDGAGDVVTPLSVRDPLSLIRGASKAPEAPSAPPSNYRDTLKNVAKNSFSAASKSAGAPTVIPRMQGGLRTMSSFAGSGGTRTSGKIPKGKMLADAKNASSKAARRSMTGPKASADYRGVSSNPKRSSKGAMEDLRNRAGKSAGHFSGGSATDAVDKAAADAVNIGGSGGLGQGEGSKDDKYKGPSNSSLKNFRNRGARKKTLAEELEDEREKKKLEWEMFKKYEICKQIVQSFLDKVVKEGIMGPIGTAIADATKGILGYGPRPPSLCWIPIGKDGKPSGSVDDCFDRGSIGIPIVSGGKQSTSGTTLLDSCLCGKGSSPVRGDEFGKEKSAEGSTNQLIVDPQVESAYKEFDIHLRNTVNAVIEGENNIDDMEKLEPHFDTVHIGINGLNDVVNSGVLPNLEALAREYDKVVVKSENKLRTSETIHARAKDRVHVFISQMDNIVGNIENLKGKVSKGRERVLPRKQRDTIRKAAIQEKQRIVGNMVGYTRLLKSDKAKYRFYSQKTKKLRSGRESMYEALQSANAYANAIKENEMNLSLPEQFKQMTARPENSTMASSKGFRDAAGNEAPFKTIIKKRGISWDKLFEKDHEFNADETVKIENEEWGEIEKQLKMDKIPTDNSRLDNFVSNGMRCVSLKEGVDNLYLSIETTDNRSNVINLNISSATKHLVSLGVRPCYFDNTCGDTTSPAVTPKPETKPESGSSSGNTNAFDNNRPSGGSEPKPETESGAGELSAFKKEKDRVMEHTEVVMDNADRYIADTDGAGGRLGCKSNGCNKARDNAMAHSHRMGKIREEISLLSSQDASSEKVKEKRLKALQEEFNKENRAFYGTPIKEINAKKCVNNNDSKSGMYFALACSRVPNRLHRTVSITNKTYNVTNVVIVVNQGSLIGDNTFVITLNNGKKYEAEIKGNKWKIVKELKK